MSTVINMELSYRERVLIFQALQHRINILRDAGVNVELFERDQLELMRKIRKTIDDK